MWCWAARPMEIINLQCDQLSHSLDLKTGRKFWQINFSNSKTSTAGKEDYDVMLGENLTEICPHQILSRKILEKQRS